MRKYKNLFFHDDERVVADWQPLFAIAKPDACKTGEMPNFSSRGPGVYHDTQELKWYVSVRDGYVCIDDTLLNAECDCSTVLRLILNSDKPLLDFRTCCIAHDLYLVRIAPDDWRVPTIELIETLKPELEAGLRLHVEVFTEPWTHFSPDSD